MKLYHGTGKAAAKNILYGHFRNGMDDGMSWHGEDIEGVWTTEELYHAAQYGRYVIEIELPDNALDHARAVWKDEGPYDETEIVFDAEWLNANWKHLKCFHTGNYFDGLPWWSDDKLAEKLENQPSFPEAFQPTF